MAADTAPTRARMSFVIAGLLVAATLFFVWGALAERSGHDEVHTSATTHQEGGGETTEQHAPEGSGGAASSESTEYRPLGVNLESTALIVAAALVSLGLAALVAFRPTPPVLIAVVALGVVFVVFEIVEVVHQVDVDEFGLLTLALIAAFLHASAATLAGIQLRASPHPEQGGG